MQKRIALSGLLLTVCLAASMAAEEEPYWYEPMKAINTEFEGNPGFVAQFGDSITASMAFWSAFNFCDPVPFLPEDGLPKMPAQWKRWRDIIKGARNKAASGPGWRVGNLLPAVEALLKKEQPEVAIIMIGTNDMNAGPQYRAGLQTIIEKCLAARCIPILNTIPPRRGRMDTVKQINDVVRELAQKYKVPLVDYYAEILKRRPGETWDGTLISNDGVHPSAPNTIDFSEANLRNSGYALRSWVNFLMYRDLYFKILNAPKSFVEKIGTVEDVREGIRCPVVADTEVSFYRDPNDNETLWNWGKASTLKLKGREEYALMKFDVAKCEGMTVKKATLYLPRAVQCVLNVVAPSTVSTDWAEGTGKGRPGNKQDQGSESKGGATYTRAIYPGKTWAGPDSNFKWVVFGEGGSTYEARETGWAKDDKANYYTVDVPLDVVHGLLVKGDSYGMAMTEEKGQRGFQKTYRRVPNPNHFIHSRETATPPFLVIEGAKVDKTAPAPVGNPSATSGQEAGDILLNWTCTADDGKKGGKALGYSVYLGKGRLGKKVVREANLLPRYRTYRPKPPAAKQEFPIDSLEPGATYTFAVVAYDEAGNLSKPAIFEGTTRAKKTLALKSPDIELGTGSPVTKGNLRVWGAASNAKINPQTGNAMKEGSYKAAAAVGKYRNGNSVWDGKLGAVKLFAGRNDFIGFQLVAENLGKDKLTGLNVRVSDLQKDSRFSAVNRYMLLSMKDVAGFQASMRELMVKDKALSDRVFAALKQLNAYKKKQQEDPAAFFQEMETLRAKNVDEYDNWMFLLGGGKTAGSTAVASKNIDLFWEWSIKSADGAWYPDALVPVSGKLNIPNVDNGVADQKIQAFYVDVFVPHKTEPGTYSGEIMISANDVDSFSIPIQLTVWNFKLPDTLNFISDMNGYSYPAFDKNKHWEGVLNLHRLAHKNRLNVNIVPVTHTGNFSVYEMALPLSGKGKEKQITSFSTFERHFGPLFSGKAFVDNPRANVPVAAHFLQFYENWPGRTKEGFTFDQSARTLDVADDFTQEYKDAYIAVAGQMAEWFKKKGYTQTDFQVFLNSKYHYADDVTFWLLDEPMFRDDFMAIKFFGRLTREGFKNSGPVTVDFRIDCSRSEEARGMLNELDTFVGSSNIRKFPRLVRDQARTYIRKPNGKPRKLWTYGASNLVPYPNVANRSWTIESYLFGCDGLLPWSSYGSDDSWDSAEKASGAVFYPATTKWNYNGAYGSLRMKSFRDGQQDVECLVLLAKKLGATRKELDELLNTFIKLRGEFKEDLVTEQADVISYANLVSDDLCRLRRAVGYNLDLLAGGK
ncbi:MAG: DUF4091 domain-containing protein [Lentisphaerae bacterium]|nr:DUF4091 domain-containing protein [Lentisphaerota bacterium]